MGAVVYVSYLACTVGARKESKIRNVVANTFGERFTPPMCGMQRNGSGD